MHLVLIDAGGTISAADRGRGYDGGELGDDVLAAVRRAAPDARLEVRRVYAGLSEAMGFGDAMAVVQAVRAACLEPAVAAVLVIHGTDAMEEVAFLCDLMVRSGKPVVFTGSQRAPSEPGHDGPRNLRDAVLTAARPRAALAGVLLVFGGCILTATRARKVHAQSLEAFGPPAAVIGRTDATGALPVRAERPLTLACETLCEAVEIVTLGLASEGRLLNAAAAPPTRGVVLQALGCGNASNAVVRAVEDAVKAGCLVGVASGCFEGRAAAQYASGRRLAEAGAVFMGELDPRRARLLMACALGDDRGLAQARALITPWLA